MESRVGRTGLFSGGHAGSVRIETRPKMTIVEVEPANRAGDRQPARGQGRMAECRGKWAGPKLGVGWF
jgi:hypothetical protein